MGIYEKCISDEVPQIIKVSKKKKNKKNKPLKPEQVTVTKDNESQEQLRNQETIENNADLSDFPYKKAIGDDSMEESKTSNEENGVEDTNCDETSLFDVDSKREKNNVNDIDSIRNLASAEDKIDEEIVHEYKATAPSEEDSRKVLSEDISPEKRVSAEVHDNVDNLDEVDDKDDDKSCIIFESQPEEYIENRDKDSVQGDPIGKEKIYQMTSEDKGIDYLLDDNVEEYSPEPDSTSKKPKKKKKRSKNEAKISLEPNKKKQEVEHEKKELKDVEQKEVRDELSSKGIEGSIDEYDFDGNHSKSVGYSEPINTSSDKDDEEGMIETEDSPPSIPNLKKKQNKIAKKSKKELQGSTQHSAGENADTIENDVHSSTAGNDGNEVSDSNTIKNQK